YIVPWLKERLRGPPEFVPYSWALQRGQIDQAPAESPAPPPNIALHQRPACRVRSGRRRSNPALRKFLRKRKSQSPSTTMPIVANMNQDALILLHARTPRRVRARLVSCVL